MSVLFHDASPLQAQPPVQVRALSRASAASHADMLRRIGKIALGVLALIIAVTAIVAVKAAVWVPGFAHHLGAALGR
jgi:hypothetical protein